MRLQIQDMSVHLTEAVILRARSAKEETDGTSGNLSPVLPTLEITKPVKTATVEQSEGTTTTQGKRPTIETTGPPGAMKTKVDTDQLKDMLRRMNSVVPTNSKALVTSRTKGADILATPKDHGIKKSSHAAHVGILTIRRSNHTDPMAMLTVPKAFVTRRNNHTDPMDTPIAPKAFGTKRSSHTDPMDTLATPKGLSTRRSCCTAPIDMRNVSKAMVVSPDPTTRVVDTTITGIRTVVAMSTGGVTGTMNARRVVGAVNMRATVVSTRGVQTAKIIGEGRGPMGAMNAVRILSVSTGSTYRAGMKTTQIDEGIAVTRNGMSTVTVGPTTEGLRTKCTIKSSTSIGSGTQYNPYRGCFSSSGNVAHGRIQQQTSKSFCGVEGTRVPRALSAVSEHARHLSGQ